MSSLISPENTTMIWCVLIVVIFLSMYAERHYRWAAAIGAGLICLISGMVFASLGIMPTDSPAYGPIFGLLLPVAIPLLLFNANIVAIYKKTGKLAFMFLIACTGCMLGVTFASFLFRNQIPELHKVAAILTGSQTGGSLNMVVMADVFDISTNSWNSVLIGDTVSFVFTLTLVILLPEIKFLRKYFRTSYPTLSETHKDLIEESRGLLEAKNQLDVFSMAKGLALSFVIVAVSFAFTNFINSLNPPFIIGQLFGSVFLIITLITVIVATLFPNQIGKISGSQELGMFIILAFFFVASVGADLKEVIRIGPSILLFCFATFIIFITFSLIFGRVFKFSIEEISIAVNASLGGPTTAAAAAAARGYKDLITPGILCGILGYILGNYFGVFIGNMVFKLFGI